MSHTVTVTRTTTTATTSALLINTGYLRTIPGILKFFETVEIILKKSVHKIWRPRWGKFTLLCQVFVVLKVLAFLDCLPSQVSLSYVTSASSFQYSLIQSSQSLKSYCCLNQSLSLTVIMSVKLFIMRAVQMPSHLEFITLIIGAVCVGLIANYSYYTIHRYQNYNTDIFFLIVTSAFLICTFAILVSCIISISTASILPKTIFELIYHGLAFVLYIIASICLIVEVNRYRHSRYEYDPLLAASILGLINSGLYLLSTGFAYKSYRGG